MRASGKWNLLAVAVLAVMQFSCQRQETREQPGAPSPAAEAPQAGEMQKAQAAGEWTIEVGETTRISSTQVAVPLSFYAADSRDVGRVHAEIAVPDGPYEFSSVEPAEKRRWKISARQNGKVIAVDISGGGAAIIDGMVGRLVFDLREGSAPDHVPLTVNHVHTLPPEAQAGPPKAAGGELPATPDSSAPSPGCFFFTH